ncbi:hypothetical protein HPB50_021710 [Hyalomma asiaticum]|uniref:Uncharacterized protein n=1 Tax=Hyalomma asiaticum TaxID=266040 RepID=A0ACB7RZC3_HYAAI|nr:hypothetical protein HPB50_021710 [Hyalomma asiaticum]
MQYVVEGQTFSAEELLDSSWQMPGYRRRNAADGNFKTKASPLLILVCRIIMPAMLHGDFGTSLSQLASNTPTSIASPLAAEHHPFRRTAANTDRTDESATATTA